MSYIPNCRKDEYYNEKYLTCNDSECVSGYDLAVETIENFFDNLDVYNSELDIEGEDINLSKFLENHPAIKEKFRNCAVHWLEMQRNELIVSMIDEMEDEEYDEIKAKKDAE